MEDIIAINLLCGNTCSICAFYYPVRPADGDYDHCKPEIETCNHWKLYVEEINTDPVIKRKHI